MLNETKKKYASLMETLFLMTGIETVFNQAASKVLVDGVVSHFI